MLKSSREAEHYRDKESWEKGTIGNLAARAQEALLRRRLSQLGGTTTMGDCLVALRFLLFPYRLVAGEAITEFENAFARLTGVRYASSFSAGRIGLYGILKAIGIGPGDEVLMQVPTHIVVPNAVRYLGASPVYVDCCRSDYNIDIKHAERLVSPATKVLILQHTFGVPADITAAQDLAKRHNLTLIEDCVHALGATYKGQPVGSFGHAAFFSTEETKIISTTMGGMVVTDDPDLAAKMHAFKQSCPVPNLSQSYLYILKIVVYHILTEPHLHRFARTLYDLLGSRHPLPKPTDQDELAGLRPALYEQRLSHAQALLGLRQLNRLKENLAHRRHMAELYRQSLEKGGFKLTEVSPENEPSWVRYPVWVKNRLQAEKILAPYTVVGTWFTSVLEEAISPEVADYKAGDCPIAEEAARQLVNLPTHQRVKKDDVERIVSAMAGLRE